MADTRTYIRVHDGMPDHPKVDGLSDKAFRLLVESWCWSSRHLTDGTMPASVWRKRATARARRELIDAGLAILAGETVRFHDYLEHQRSAEEVEELKAARAEGGSYGAHVRWHLRRRIVHPDCEHCRSTTYRSTHGSSHSSSYGSSHADDPEIESRTGNFDSGKRSLTSKSSDEESPDKTPGHDQPTSGNAIAPPIGHAWQMHGKPMTSTSTETEVPTSGRYSEGSLSRQSTDRYARERADDDPDLDHAIAGLVEQHTGRPCPPDHAAKVRRQILDGRDVEKPLPYVVRAIRDNPGRFMPPPPPTPPRAEPWMDVPDLGHRDNGETNARGRAAVEAAIAAAKNRATDPAEQEDDQP